MENISSVSEKFSTKFKELLINLNHENKYTKRKSLLDIKKELCNNQFQEEQIGIIVDRLTQLILNESVDSLREIAAEILLEAINRYELDNKQIESVLTLPAKQLPAETCEEVRLLLAKLYNQLIKALKNGEAIFTSLEAVTNSVSLMLRDRYSEVIKEACTIVLELSVKNQHFRLQTDYFADPLVNNLKHQQGKVRIAAVKAMKTLLIHNSLLIPKLAPHLTRQMLDSNPTLRLTVVSELGDGLPNFDWEDDNTYLLVPIILVATCDEFVEIANKAKMVWQQFGQCALEHRMKNELKNDLKGTTFVISECLEHLLTGVQRDLEDWNGEVRVKALQLLFQLLTELERNLSHTLDKILEFICFGSGDQDEVANRWSLKCAFVVGQHCPNQSIEWISKRPISLPETLVFAEVLQGSTTSSIDLDIPTCLDVLDKCANVTEVWDLLLKCIDIIFKNSRERKDMDRILSLVLSVGGQNIRNPSIIDRVSALLIQAVGSSYSSVSEMLEERAVHIFGNLEDSSASDHIRIYWNIFTFIFHHWALYQSCTILQLFLKFIDLQHSPEVRMKSLNLLASSIGESTASNTAILEQFVPKIIDNLRWKAGRTAASLRTAAATCMWAMIHHRVVKIRRENFEEYVSIILPLVEDEQIITRLTACRILKLCCLSFSDLPQNEASFKVLIGRLDDSSREIRKEAMDALSEILIHIHQTSKQQPNFQDKFLEILSILSHDEDAATKGHAISTLKLIDEKLNVKINIDGIDRYGDVSC